MRKRLTERFPALIPIRTWQRKLFFYCSKRFDGNTYSEEISESLLPYEIKKSISPLINKETGLDILYQYNKVFNLKLASEKISGLLIKPGESMSLCLRLRDSDKYIRYKDALVVINGKLTAGYGGGLCQLSSLLYYLFLHTDLEITERKGHATREFQDTCDCPKGLDATFAEGWTDLSVKNNGNTTYQIKIDFSEENITGRILSDSKPVYILELGNKDLRYEFSEGKVIERVKVVRKKKNAETGADIGGEVLYENECIIGYEP